MKPTTHNIQLKDLVAWDGNVRKTEGSDTAVAELAASIQSVGIINPLTVFPKGKKFAVVAGSRRHAALLMLLKQGNVTENYAVACTLTDEQHASEISLAENVIRENMHPADEFDAFLKLSKDGIPNADIAAKFGVTETVVTKRLKLARVSPQIIKAYRDGDLDLECVMAYAVVDDKRAQEKVRKSLSKWQAKDADAIRSALTESEIDATDRRVKFVTLKAYEKAGGKTRQDLFTEGDHGVFVLDVDLLNGLVTKKLEKTAAAARKEGWNWVEIRDSFGYDEKSKFRQLREVESDLTPELQAEAETLEAEQEAIYGKPGDHDEVSDEDSTRLETIEARLEEIADTREWGWLEGAFEVAGAVVSIGYDGKADVARGLVKPGDVKRLPKPKSAKPVTDDGDDPDLQAETPQSTGLSGKLVEQLTEHRSAALNAVLIDKPDVALAAVVHALASGMFCGHTSKTCLLISLRDHSRSKTEGSTANERIDRARQHWGDTVPGTPDTLWTWCLDQDRDTLIDLLAFCAASSIDAVVKKRGNMDYSTSTHHADMVAAAVDFDMGFWFKPNAENYFGHVSKPQILEALTEAGKSIAPAWNKAKKGELAAIAERQIAGTAWLPEILRSPVEDSAREVKNAA